jgi:hypothetical protein
MSRAVDLFIRSELEPADLAARIAEITGFLAEQTESGWRLHDEGFEAVLSEHSFVDDYDLLLSRYRYVLGCRVSEGTRMKDAPATIMLRMVADQLQQKAGLSVLLVLDLQYRDGPAEPTRPDTAPEPSAASASAASANGAVTRS